MIEKIARDLDKPVDAAIRVNMDAGIYPVWDRFGFNLDNGEAMKAAQRIHAGGMIRLTGVHSHIGTYVTETSAYGTATAKLAALARAVEKSYGFTIDYIDVGGGFSSKSTLHTMYAPGRESNPPVEQYAEAITGAMYEAGFPPDRLPTLVFETGRALIDDAGYLLTSVVGNKRLPNGTRTMIVDGGVNLLFTSTWYQHDILPAEAKEGLYEETVIYGPLCMNIDVVRPSVSLPVMEPGDALVIHPVGAYNVTQWMQFIRMRPAVVLIGENREIDVIRDAEVVETLKDLEHVPDRFRSLQLALTA
jgi:diaminopimelate decarboxylase